jgi:hypothetical protein
MTARRTRWCGRAQVGVVVAGLDHQTRRARHIGEQDGHRLARELAHRARHPSERRCDAEAPRVHIARTGVIDVFGDLRCHPELVFR